MRIITLANHKGGVGKSATVHALGVVLSREHGRSVLLVDCDPQGSLTASCGVMDAEDASLAQVLGSSTPGSKRLEEIVVEVAADLWLAPADIELSRTELGLVTRIGRENTLKRALATMDGAFDVVLIDSPPSLGLLTVNTLTAADAVLIPTQPQIVDLRGLRLFLETVGELRGALNEGLEILGILLTFYDGRLIHHRSAVRAMEKAGLPVLPVQIGRSVRVAEAASEGESVVTYEPDNKRALEYRALGEVVDAWLSDAEK